LVCIPKTNYWFAWGIGVLPPYPNSVKDMHPELCVIGEVFYLFVYYLYFILFFHFFCSPQTNYWFAWGFWVLPPYPNSVKDMHPELCVIGEVFTFSFIIIIILLFSFFCGLTRLERAYIIWPSDGMLAVGHIYVG